ncbi:hypothetical protein [Leeuwenhoekiella parthenopeia]|uniref:Guanylate cyclase domain-containing protein n=1 Tax=Leeuwenhoekiella parthenopeia TaxID=2890320 RepID=A0ABS8GUF4_9FLAO|nr:hypothetical protein [Leeuwenhoekiella parthenopeia]MCC4212842.1 hypothetical protein [Leeuwenhoekiella parthenopeia]
MYENRITFFIDILGFRNIISQTENDNKLAQGIFSVLDSMKGENITNEVFLEINETEDAKKEIEEIKKVQALFSKALIGESSIQITHFSDSIVLSIGLENDMNAMSLIEYVGRLIYRLWKDFKILIRGGVSVDKLVHIENGPLFGPAMVNAYDFETHLSVYPRIVLDDTVFNIVHNSPSFKSVKDLFIAFSGTKEVNGKEISIKRGLEINLATSFKHYMNSHFTFHPEKQKEVQEVINSSVEHLEEKKSEISSERIKEKYQYLIDQIRGQKLEK